MQSLGQAPYAPPANVIGIIRRFRERSLPESIDVDFLKDVGIPGGNAHRTLAALRFLGLVDEAGAPTAKFESLQIATEDEYRQILQGILRSSYQEAFRVIDPSKDSMMTIDNHFRRYEPISQRKRMVLLFLGLCNEASIPTLDKPRERGTKRPIAGPRKPATATAVPTRAVGTARPDDQIVGTAAPSVTYLRRQYIAALIERLRQTPEGDTELSPDLLDRIERLLQAEGRSEVTPETGMQGPEAL
ncbi:MAG: DUF5343 domain-containing protein [Dehalococcoidia bacterium]|nr:DUF5343 domain-containing protein [Dehalococcoidia bacterium]